MTTPSLDVAAHRLDLADTRSFTAPGAGATRRAALAAFGREWIGGLWEEAITGTNADGLALAAVGSFARGDAGPLSDYDLVLLHSGRMSEATVNGLAERLWYPIWDAGVRLDHSVRTVSGCRAVAERDLSAAVGLLDLTWVAGDQELVSAARSTVAHDWRANARKRLVAITEGMAGRHRRFGDVSQSIEPDLKEAHGGLRDMALLRALVEAWLADRSHGDVDAAYSFLLDVRDAVHVVTGRHRDRLMLPDHDAVAALLGYSDGDDVLTDVAQAGRTISYALDGTARRAGQSQRARVLRVGPRKPRMTPLGYGLFESDGEVVLGTSRVMSDALLPMRAAVVAARAGLPISPTTLTNLAALPDIPQPWPAMARELFADLLASGPGLVGTWEGLDQAGIIDRWLPEWAAVRSRPQRNAVHRHTVDRHLVETVVHASGLVRTVSRPDLLLLAALLHDIGKIRGAGDHSVVGAPIAEVVAVRMGYPAQDVATIGLLVREHLTLIELATRRDHGDPRTVQGVVDAVDGRREVLDLLAALTEADAVAAGPKAWTDWRSTLLAQLVASVRGRLDAGLDGAGPADVDPTDRVDHDVLVSVVGGEPVVDIRPDSGSYRVVIGDRDRLGLFADTAGLLSAEGFVVRAAQLRTIDGVALNEWQIESPSGIEPEVERIVRGLRRLAEGDRAPMSALDRRRGLTARRSSESGTGVAGQARALIVPGASADSTVLEVRAQDRPGLLHELGMAFARAGISVRSAHIATYAGQTLDTFYVTQFAGGLLEPSQVARLVSLVIDTCEA